MELTKFNFPKLDTADMMFPVIETDKSLLAEARQRGFLDGNTEYNSLFSRLFFKGGQVVFKENLDEQFKKNAWQYLRAFMGSFEPKHEHKEAICALLLSELVEPKLKGE